MNITSSDSTIVVGAGIAGLSTALRLADEGNQVTILTKNKLYKTTSYYAQGGIAAVIDSEDSLILQAQNLAKGQRTLSTSFLQRRLRIGYPRAARLMDELEDQGVVGPGDAGKAREVL